MKVTFPHMGRSSVGIKTLLTELGMDVVVPPASTTRTLALGVTHAPEFACLPLKITLGNYLEALELGAELVLMVGGSGPCRFGYYGQIQREIIKALGCQADFFVIEPPHGRFREFARQLNALTGGRSWASIIAAMRLAWAKMGAVEELERSCYHLRPLVANPKELDRLLDQAVISIDCADGLGSTRQALISSLTRFGELPAKPLPDYPLRVGLVGEIYTVLEPFANLEVGKTLGELGAEVEQSIYLTQWLGSNLFLTAIGLCSRHDRQVRRAASPYLDHFIGGHGQETIGQTVLYAQRGFDGVVHLLPFTCMPEITAQSILPKVSVEHGIPVLTLILDEQSGKAGIQTRVEAFVDLMRHRRRVSSTAAR